MAKDPLMRVVKKMYKGSGAKKINNMHRPEGAGNFDNMDDYNIVDSINVNTIAGSPVFVGGGLPFAEIYVKDSVATISVDSDNADVLVTQFTTNGLSNNCTADASNDKITITKLGVYQVHLTASVSLNAGASVDIILGAYLNGVAQPQLHADRTVSTADKGSMSFSGLIDVTSVPWDLDIRANIDSSTARDLTVEDSNLNCLQIAGT